MSQSIGELFVSLGFDVDDKKLKSFDESIKGVYNTALKLAGIGGGVAGFVELAKGAEQTALQIKNLTSVYGVSAKAIQAWAAAVHESNPLVSFSQGIESFGKISQYFSSAAFQGKGANALNRLGVSFNSDDVQHPERVIDRLFEKIPQLLAAHPSNRALYSSLIGDITGDPTNIRIFEKGKSFEDAAAQRASLYQKELDDTVKVAQDIAGLQDEWDRFYKHAMATLATGILDLEKNIKDKGFLAGLGKTLDDLGATDPFNIAATGKGLIHNGVMDNLVTAASQEYENATGNKNDAVEFWRAHGYNPAQISAWLAQEQAESSFNPRAKNGQYSGLFQWSPERADAILKATGIDVRTANHWNQLKAAEWEFRNKGLDSNFRLINDSRDASKYLSDKFEVHEKFNKQHGDETRYRQDIAEREPLQITIHQTIHSNADSEETARIANDRIKGTILDAYLNQIGVNP